MTWKIRYYGCSRIAAKALLMSDVLFYLRSAGQHHLPQDSSQIGRGAPRSQHLREAAIEVDDCWRGGTADWSIDAISGI